MFKFNHLPKTRISALIALSLAFALVTGCSRDPNVRKQKYLESGKKYEAAGKYKEAAIQFSNALKLDKNYSDAHYELAKTYIKMNSPMFAYSELLKTVDLNGSNLEARIELGNMLLAGHATDRAEAQAKAVLAINPNYADAYALLAATAQRKGDTADALQEIQHAIALDPNRATYHSALALLESADPANEANAEQELVKAASLDPKNATPHILLGMMFAKKGDTAGAEQQYLAAVSAAPKNLQARSQLAALYYRAGDKAKAEQTLRRLSKKKG